MGNEDCPLSQLYSLKLTVEHGAHLQKWAFFYALDPVAALSKRPIEVAKACIEK